MNADCPIAFKDDFVNLGIALQEKVPLISHGAVDISMCRVTTTSSVTVDPLQPLLYMGSSVVSIYTYSSSWEKV